MLCCSEGNHYHRRTPLVPRKPSREATLRIAEETGARPIDRSVIALLGDPLLARELALAHHEFSINQIATRKACWRMQFHKLVRLSWLGPNNIEAIANGR